MPSSTSYRLPTELKRRLAQRAAAEGVTETALVSRLIEEGLKTAAHPGIVYRHGATGRRAGLMNGPDVWEVVLALRSASGTGEKKVANAAAQLDLPVRSVRLAIDFAAEYPDEIERRIELNEAAAERVRRLTEARNRLLAS
jgi:hypothetical protein